VVQFCPFVQNEYKLKEIRRDIAMRKQIVTNNYRGNFCIDLFSKFAAVMGIFFVAAFLFAVLLSADLHLLAQGVEPIKWSGDVKRACQIARVENRLVIVHFYSDCAPCTSMNANVFTDPRIAIEMNRNFVAVRVDMKTQAVLAQQYNVTVVPTDLVLRADEQVVYRRQGEIAVEKYLQFLQFLRNNYLQTNSATLNPATIPSNPNNVPTNNVTNITSNTSNPVVTVPASVSVPTHSSPFPSQPDQAAVPTNSQSNFVFLVNSDQPNNPTFPSNPSHTSANPHHVISASGQMVPNKNNNNTNIAAIPSNGSIGVGGGANVGAVNGGVPIVPFAAPVVPDKNELGRNESDKNVLGKTVEVKESVAGDNINLPNNINSAAQVTAPNNTKPNPASTNADLSGLNMNGVSATNNPVLVRNSVLGNNQSYGVNVDVSGQLMVEVPLAIEGYCPVVLCKSEEWVPGNPAYYAMYRGQVYRFSSREAMEEFLKTPLKFAPVAMGEDVVMMIDRNKKVCGSRKFGVWFGGRVYLFASKESLNSFIAKPAHYANIAQNYEAAFKSPLDTVQR
jgi:YHS domain-containing protein/thioredoxin-related protein